jgi:hypothetical protein
VGEAKVAPQYDDPGTKWVYCRACDAEGPVCGNHAEAIAAWNTRAALDAATRERDEARAACSDQHERLSIARGTPENRERLNMLVCGAVVKVLRQEREEAEDEADAIERGEHTKEGE